MMKLMIVSILKIFDYVVLAPVSNSKKRVNLHNQNCIENEGKKYKKVQRRKKM